MKHAYPTFYRLTFLNIFVFILWIVLLTHSFLNWEAYTSLEGSAFARGINLMMAAIGLFALIVDFIIQLMILNKRILNVVSLILAILLGYIIIPH